MKKIKQIRIPKGDFCEKCFFGNSDVCFLFDEELTEDCYCVYWKFDECLKMFPTGAVFKLIED